MLNKVLEEHSALRWLGCLWGTLFVFLGVVMGVAELKKQSAEKPRSGWTYSDQNVSIYGDRAMRQGHVGPLWFLNVMKRVYDHPWLTLSLVVLSIVGIYLLTTAPYSR